MIGCFGQAELGPYAADEAFQDPVADGITLADANGRIAELSELGQIFVIRAVGDVLPVDV